MKIHHLLAYLQVNDAVKAIEFYTSVFGATEKFRMTDPNGRIGHAVLDFGGTTLMLAEEFPEYGFLGPLTLWAPRSRCTCKSTMPTRRFAARPRRAPRSRANRRTNSMANGRAGCVTLLAIAGASAIFSTRSRLRRCNGVSQR